VVVVEKDAGGETTIAVVGSCASGSAVRLRFRPIDQVAIPQDLPMQAGLMIQGLASPESMPNGSTRLVERYDGALEGMTITPDTYQSSAQTIVLAHLKHPDRPQPQPDVNLIGDLRPVLTDEDENRSPRPDPEQVEN
jgi:hypothetical protein